MTTSHASIAPETFRGWARNASRLGRLSIAPSKTCHYAFDDTTASTCLAKPPRAMRRGNLGGLLSTCARSVALCLAGSPRTFIKRHVHESIREHLVGGLRTAVVDVFAVLDRQDVNTDRLPHANVSESRKLKGALASVSPRALTMWQPHPLATRSRQKVVLPAGFNTRRGSASTAHCQQPPLQPPDWEADQFDSALAQIVSWSKCIELIEAEEKSRGFAYDLFVHARPDQFWLRPHPSACGFELNRSYVRTNGVGTGDQNFVLPRGLAPIVFHTMLTQYERCPSGLLRDLRGRVIGRLENWLRDTTRRTSPRHELMEHVFFPAVVVQQNKTKGAGNLCYFSTRGTGVTVTECMRALYPPLETQLPLNPIPPPSDPYPLPPTSPPTAPLSPATSVPSPDDAPPSQHAFLAPVMSHSAIGGGGPDHLRWATFRLVCMAVSSFSLCWCCQCWSWLAPPALRSRPDHVMGSRTSTRRIRPR
jgi:hypothetical protein